jgi:hypothetical protein
MGHPLSHNNMDDDGFAWAAVAVTRLLAGCAMAAAHALEAEAQLLLAAARRCRRWPL